MGREFEQFIEHVKRGDAPDRWRVYGESHVENDKIKMLKKLEEGVSLLCAGEALRDDREVALKAVKKDRYNFSFLSERLRGDEEIVLEALNGFFPFEEIHVDDVMGKRFYYEFCVVNNYRYISDALMKNEAFTRLVIKRFMESKAGEKYKKEDFEGNYKNVYEVLEAEAKRHPFYVKVGETQEYDTYWKEYGIDYSRDLANMKKAA